MLFFLPAPLRGVLAFSMYTLNTLFWFGPLMLFALLRLLVPIPFWQRWMRWVLTQIAMAWIDINTVNMKLFQNIRFEVEGLEQLASDQWYLVLSNHQSWVDILAMQRVLNRRIPFLKFFLKQELIWVPFMGIAWWALDFPFMKRYTRAFIEKHPHMKGRDIEITRKACEKFRTLPVSVVNYVEGTRFTPEKHARQQSPHAHLLRPKAGGVAFVLGAMGDQMTGIVNVTIAYPEGAKTFGQYLKGEVHTIRMHIEVLPVTDALIGDYTHDSAFKSRFCDWINALWEEKDRRLSQMLSQPPLPASEVMAEKRI
ncbi:MAG: acyltransferase [Deltaproteobacteria bacterium]|nr:MAG: acyltransferase [Deltaproteobacteria bacterium]